MSQKLVMLPSQKNEPWDVLEMNLMDLCLKSLANKECLLPMIGKASRSPFVLLLPSKQAYGVARQPLQ